MNKVQQSSFQIIQDDCKFIYSLLVLTQNDKKFQTNYVMMFTPYLALFTYGAELWGKKMNLNFPVFTMEEKEYYKKLRQSTKLYGKNYFELKSDFNAKLQESDVYFKKVRNLLEIMIGYKNVGADLCENTYIGNTILCSIYSPLHLFENETKYYLKSLAVICGKMVGSYLGDAWSKYIVNKNIKLSTRDFHFYENCPIKMKSDCGLVLFSILCSINYCINFLEKVILEESAMKFKAAYLQYYYLCDFLPEFKEYEKITIEIDRRLYNSDFRNCIAHYGLGVYMKEDNIIVDDILKGLTNKAFHLDYCEAKRKLYYILSEVVEQIEEIIF